LELESLALPAAQLSEPPLSPLTGIALKILSALAFTLMSAVAKYVSVRYPVGQVIFSRSFFALVPLLVWLWWREELPSALRTRNIRGHLKRGIIGSIGMFCGFGALALLPLPDAVAIGYAAPLIVVVLAAVVLKERVRMYRWSAVAIGFVGVLIMLSPHFEAADLARGLGPGPTLGAVLALLGACCSASATIEIRRLTATEMTGAIVFYFMLMTTVLGLATSLLGWNMPTASDAGLLLLVGIFGGFGQILMTQSYRFADTSLIAPFEYTTMIWAVAVGWIFFGELPVKAIVIGSFIVTMAGLFVIWREQKLGLLRRETREAGPNRAI
jgi:drug/metabolite transporter (DMT)-like permease